MSFHTHAQNTQDTIPLLFRMFRRASGTANKTPSLMVFILKEQISAL
jgi:hypothetical protein